MSLEITTSDLLILEKHRIERLRSFFTETLTRCYVFLDKYNSLEIHCSEAWIVDELLEDIEQLGWFAWVIVGASRLSLYFAQEEIYSTNTHQLNQQN